MWNKKLIGKEVWLLEDRKAFKWTVKDHYSDVHCDYLLLQTYYDDLDPKAMKLICTDRNVPGDCILLHDKKEVRALIRKLRKLRDRFQAQEEELWKKLEALQIKTGIR